MPALLNSAYKSFKVRRSSSVCGPVGELLECKIGVKPFKTAVGRANARQAEYSIILEYVLGILRLSV